jgi:hypothetical protein
LHNLFKKKPSYWPNFRYNHSPPAIDFVFFVVSLIDWRFPMQCSLRFQLASTVKHFLPFHSNKIHLHPRNLSHLLNTYSRCIQLSIAVKRTIRWILFIHVQQLKLFKIGSKMPSSISTDLFDPYAQTIDTTVIEMLN